MKRYELRPNTIILTSSKEEVEKLHDIVGHDIDISQRGYHVSNKHFLYDGNWVWFWNGNVLSGTSGKGDIEHAVRSHPYSRIILCSQLKHTVTTKL
jgi:hypothetical protein